MNHLRDVLASCRREVQAQADHLQSATGLELEFRPLPDGSLYRAEAGFDANNQRMFVALSKNSPEVDVAHELQHLLMEFCDGFPVPAFKPRKAISGSIEVVCKTLRGYIADEVVHKRLVDLGFEFEGEIIDRSLFDRFQTWPSEIASGTWHSLGREVMEQLGRGLLARSAFYAQAGLLQQRHAAHLSEGALQTADGFLSACRVSLPEVALCGDRILDLFNSHDVDTPSGHKEIILGWIEIEGVQDAMCAARYLRCPDGSYQLVPIDPRPDVSSASS